MTRLISCQKCPKNNICLFSATLIQLLHCALHLKSTDVLTGWSPMVLELADKRSECADLKGKNLCYTPPFKCICTQEWYKKVLYSTMSAKIKKTHTHLYSIDFSNLRLDYTYQYFFIPFWFYSKEKNIFKKPFTPICCSLIEKDAWPNRLYPPQ